MSIFYDGKMLEEAGGRGRMGGPLAAGPGGTCVCPKCGYETKHGRGDPCMDKECPKCGAKMTRKDDDGEGGEGSSVNEAGGRGRMGGEAAGGPGGKCVCPECGYEEEHETAEPCYEKECPECGAEMVRGDDYDEGEEEEEEEEE